MLKSHTSPLERQEMLYVVLDPSGRCCLPSSYTQIDPESSLLPRQAHLWNRNFSMPLVMRQVTLAM